LLVVHTVEFRLLLFICEYLRISQAASELLQQRYHKKDGDPRPAR